jgi:Uma2 family endonuclease
MTVEEFLQLPETEPYYSELHRGELVQVTRPTKEHRVVQKRLERYLFAIATGSFWVEDEFAFRPLPEHELRVADVGAVTMERWDNVPMNAVLQGTPELVIEVLSPSNTAGQINDKERLCLKTGCREFWVVDPKLRQVKVSTPDGITRTYEAGQEIPLNLFGTGTLPVNEIFP